MFPLGDGGCNLNLHPALFYAARTAALTQQRIDEHNQAAVMRAFADEIAALHAQLSTLMAYLAQTLARADPLACNVRSVRMLQKRFMALVYLENVRTIREHIPLTVPLLPMPGSAIRLPTRQAAHISTQAWEPG